MGVVFYALCTGTLPFNHPNISELLRMVKKGTYTIPSYVDEDIQDLLRRMLCVDVHVRSAAITVATWPLAGAHQNHGNQIPSLLPRQKSSQYLLPIQSSTISSTLSAPGTECHQALEYMKMHPITRREDIQFSVVQDMEVP